jgi:quercetin dioxygenase-like cupin family protein
MGFLDTTERRDFSPEKLQKLNLFETPQMFCDIYCLEPGQAQKVHSHAGATKFYFVLEGSGHFTIGDETRTLGPGGLAWSAPDQAHGVEASSAARLVCLVAMGPNPNFS